MASNRYLLRTPENDKDYQNQTPEQLRYGPKLTSTPHVYTTSPSGSISIDLGSKLDDSEVPPGRPNVRSEQECQELHTLQHNLKTALQYNQVLQEEVETLENEKKKILDELDVLKRVKSASLNSSKSSHHSEPFILVEEENEPSSVGNQSEDIREHYGRLKREYRESQEANIKLYYEKEQLEDAVQSRDAKLKKLTEKIHDLEEGFTKLTDENKDLAMTIEERDAMVAHLVQENTELKHQHEDIVRERSFRRKSLSFNGSLSYGLIEPKDMAQEVIDIQLRETKEALHEREEQLEELHAELSQKCAELSEVKLHAEILQKELEEEREGLAKEKQTVTTLVQDAEKVKKQLCDLIESSKVDYEAKINRLELYVSELSTCKKTLEDVTQVQQEQLLKLENELGATKVDYSSRISMLLNQIDVLTADLGSKQSQLDELRENLNAKTAEVRKAEGKIEEVQEKLNVAFADCEKQKENVRIVEHEKNEVVSLNQKLVEESECLKIDIQGLVVQLPQLAREKDELAESYQELEKKLLETKEELKATQKIMESVTKKNLMLSEDLVTEQQARRESEEVRKKLEVQVEDLLTTVDSTERALASAEANCLDLKRKNQDLDVKIGNLISDNEVRVMALETAKTALEMSLNESEQQKQQDDRSLAELRDELEKQTNKAVRESTALNEKLAALTAKFEAERESVSSLTMRLEEKCVALDQAQSKIHQLAEDLVAETSERDQLDEKLQKTLETADQLTSALKCQQEEICSLKLQQDAVCTDYERKITSLHKENEIASKLITEKTGLAKLLESSIQSKEARITFLDQQNNETESKLFESLQRIEELQQTREETEKALAEVKSKLESSNSLTEKLETERMKLEEDLNHSQIAFEKTIRALHERIEELQQCNKNLEAVGVQQVKDMSELRTEIEMIACKAKTETEELQHAVSAKEAELLTANKNILNLQSSLDETMRSLQSYTSKAVAWENDYNAAMSEVESLAVEANKMKNLNSESELEISKLNIELEAFKKKYDTEVQRLEQLLEKERDGYQKAIEEARNHIQVLTSELETTKNNSEVEIERLNRIGSTDRGRIQKLETDIHAIMTTNEELKSSSDSKISSLTDQLEDHHQLIESQKKQVIAAEVTLNETCSKYSDEIAVLNETIKHFEEEIQSLNASTAASKEETQTMRTTLTQEIEAAQLKVVDYEGKIQQLTSEVQEAEKRQKFHMEECQKRENDLTQKLNDAHKNYSGLMAGAHEKIKKLQQAIQEEESSKCDIKKKIEEVRAQAIEETKEKYKQRCAEFQQNAYEAIDEFKLMNEILKTEILDLKAGMEKLQNENKQLKEKTEKMDEENNKLLRDRGLLRRDLLECQQKIHSMKQSEVRLDDNNGTFRVPSTASLHRRHQTSDSSLMTMSSASSILGSTSFMDAETVLKSHDFSMASGPERRLSTASVSSNISNTSTSSDKFKAVPTGTGSLFTCEDEDEFQFQEKNIADLKYRRQTGTAHLQSLSRSKLSVDAEFDTMSDKERFSELYRRNSMVPQHLRSCYPSEMMMCDDQEIDETRLKQLSNGMLRAKSGPALRAKEDVVPPASSLSSSSLKSPGKLQLRNGVPATAQRKPFTIV